jgi:hypothetical protein
VGMNRLPGAMNASAAIKDSSHSHAWETLFKRETGRPPTHREIGQHEAAKFFAYQFDFSVNGEGLGEAANAFERTTSVISVDRQGRPNKLTGFRG